MTEMNFEQLFEQMNAIKRAWGIFVKGPCPVDSQLAIWINQDFTDAEYLHAFKRTGMKLNSTEDIAAETLSRYATGVLISERRTNKNREVSRG